MNNPDLPPVREKVGLDGNVEMARFLLEHGANPNYNSFLTDITSEEEKASVSSTSLFYVYDEVDDYSPEELAIEKLLYQYGGRIFNWGYDGMFEPYSGKFAKGHKKKPG